MTREFRDRVGNQYTNMKSMDWFGDSLQAWDSLLRESVQHARILRQTFSVKYVEYEPYTKASQMFSDLENHTMQVSVLHNTHPLWTTEQNLDFRFAHDILGHWKMGSCHNVFNFIGEVAAFKSQCRYLRNRESKLALQTEVIGQAAYRGTFGEFGPQKIGLMKDVIL